MEKFTFPPSNNNNNRLAVVQSKRCVLHNNTRYYYLYGIPRVKFLFHSNVALLKTCNVYRDTLYRIAFDDKKYYLNRKRAGEADRRRDKPRFFLIEFLLLLFFF